MFWLTLPRSPRSAAPQALSRLNLSTLVSMARKTGLLEELTAVRHHHAPAQHVPHAR
jgi:hypothetical protein